MLIRLLIVFSLLTGCQPRGQFGSQPDPAPNSGLSSSSVRGMTRGLPEFCSYQDKSKFSGCLRCVYHDVISLKCFETLGSLDVDRVCSYSESNLRCLVTKEAKLVVIDFGKDLEDVYDSGLPTLIETLKTVIADDKSLSVRTKQHAIALLVFVEDHGSEFFEDGSYLEKFGELEKKICVESSCDSQKIHAEFRKNIALLRVKRDTGTLSVKDAFDMIMSLSRTMIQDQRVYKLLQDINIDGLIGP